MLTGTDKNRRLLVVDSFSNRLGDSRSSGKVILYISLMYFTSHVISASRLKELDKNKPIVVCCASGARSEAALRILKQNGFAEVINAGPWTNI